MIPSDRVVVKLDLGMVEQVARMITLDLEGVDLVRLGMILLMDRIRGPVDLDLDLMILALEIRVKILLGRMIVGLLAVDVKHANNSAMI
jgi:hypothetical protein